MKEIKIVALNAKKMVNLLIKNDFGFIKIRCCL